MLWNFFLSLYQHLLLSELFFGGWGVKLWVYKCWGMETVHLRVNDNTNDCTHSGFPGMIQLASAWSSCVEGFVWCPSSWAKQGTLSMAAIPAVVNHLPPLPNLNPLSLVLSLSLSPALICKRRLIRAWGPWWNFAVIVPNFSNIFYCLHHSFTGGRQGDCVNYANDVAHFCRLLHSVAIVCENLIIKYYYAHVSFNFPKLCFNLISPPAAHPSALSQNQSSLARQGQTNSPQFNDFEVRTSLSSVGSKLWLEKRQTTFSLMTRNWIQVYSKLTFNYVAPNDILISFL